MTSLTELVLDLPPTDAAVAPAVAAAAAELAAAPVENIK